MIKITTNIKLNYTYDASRKYHKYSFDNGATWCNGGQFKATVFIHGVGHGFRGLDNIAFDKGNDFPEWACSLKSGRATLCYSIAETEEETIKEFFNRTAAKNYGWLVQGEENIICYLMSTEEFTAFVKRFGKWEEERKVIRFPEHSNKLVRWFNKRIEKEENYDNSEYDG